MDYLPVEVVSYIFRFLGLSDRKEATLVCRRWYEASLDPILLRDTVVTFHAPATTGELFSQLGRRKTPHLVLDQIDGSFSSKNFLLHSCRHLTENLESVSLKGSNITENLFTELMARCFNIQSIDISFCNSLFMSGQLLAKSTDQEELRSSLVKVKELNLSSIRYMSDVTFNRMMYVCPNVEKLHLAGNTITFHSDAYYGRGQKTSSSVLTFQAILDCIEQRHDKIHTLTFSRTSIDDSALKRLANIPNLNIQGLSLVCCRELSDAGVVALAKSQGRIETLDLSQNTELSDGTLASICANLHHLRHLKLNKCRMISDSSMGNLYMLEDLEKLELASNYMITARAFVRSACNGKLRKLKYLDLGCCSDMLRDSFAVGISTSLSSNLIFLDLSSSKISDVGMQYICGNLTGLQTLILKWSSLITDAGLTAKKLDVNINAHLKHENDGACKCTRRKMGENILNLPQKDQPKKAKEEETGVPDPKPISNLRNLQTLDLSNCPAITDISLENFSFNNLRRLHISSNPKLTNKGLEALASKVAGLEELHVNQCPLVSDDGLTAIVQHQRRLRSLNVASCDQITNNFLKTLETYGSRLKELDVSLCGGLTNEAVDSLASNMKQLVSIQRRLIGIS